MATWKELSDLKGLGGRVSHSAGMPLPRTVTARPPVTTGSGLQDWVACSPRGQSQVPAEATSASGAHGYASRAGRRGRGTQDELRAQGEGAPSRRGPESFLTTLATDQKSPMKHTTTAFQRTVPGGCTQMPQETPKALREGRRDQDHSRAAALGGVGEARRPTGLLVQ